MVLEMILDSRKTDYGMNEIRVYVKTMEAVGLYFEILSQNKTVFRYIAAVKRSFKFCFKNRVI
jgi:hypothetical protein